MKRYTHYVFYNRTTREMQEFTNWSKRKIRKRLEKAGKPRDWEDITKNFEALYESCELSENEVEGR